jgi:hypothetical protein
VPNRKLTEAEAKEYLLRSNKNTGEWDMILLPDFDINLLHDIGFEDFEIFGGNVSLSDMGIGLDRNLKEDSGIATITFEFDTANVDIVINWIKKHSKEELSAYIVSFCASH